MDPGVENWRGDNWCERSEYVAWPAPRVRLREATPREQRQGSGGCAPENFLEFIKRANYPEKQSGTSWQKIKPYFYGSYSKFSRLTLKKWENKN